MRIVQVHNRYRHHGGEDAVLETERDLLIGHGHEVHQYLKDNRLIDEDSNVATALSGIWSNSVYREFRTLLRRLRPSVVHVHNTMPLISPSVYYASAAENVPVIQTLHNYRLLCIGGQFLRDNRICEDCINTKCFAPGFRHKCYRQNLAATSAVGAMLVTHWGLSTWRSKITRYIALTAFARDKFICGGLPPAKISVKPNFMADPGYRPWSRAGRSGALYVGRLTAEKGIQQLLSAWSEVDYPLDVVGDGPMLDELRRVAPSTVRFHGHLAKPDVMALMQKAAFLAVPSICYETFSLVLMEAFATGLPVVASRIGAMAEIVRDGDTGILFNPGDIDDMREKIALAVGEENLLRMVSQNARKRYEDNFTPGRNYEMLKSIYEQAIADTATSAA